MIFVTVGAQMPFDRLIKTVDQWAGERGRHDVFAQIGLTDYRPTNIQWKPFLSTEEFKQQYEIAKVIVAHAGTGSIITALQLGKPILVMPRRANLHETRNNHQVATSRQFCRFDSVVMAVDEKELFTQLDEIDNLHGRAIVEPYASWMLVGAIRDFIDEID